MRILYWGNNKSGYRQSEFIDYMKRRKDDIFFSIAMPEVKGKLKKNILEYFYEFKTIPLLRKVDIVYFPPMEHMISKLIWAKIFRKKIICDIYAPIYDMTVNDEKKYSAYSLMGRRYYYRDRICMKLSDNVLFLNNAEKKYFINTVDLNEKDVCSSEVPLVINEKKVSKLKYFHKKREHPYLCWTGSFIALQGLECIIDSIAILKSNNYKVKLFVIGPQCEKAEYYQRIVKERRLEDYIEFPNIWGNMEYWEEFISENCDITLGIFGSSGKAKSVVANKVVDGIITKTPVITGKSEGIDLFFNQKSDIYTTENEPDKLAKKIMDVAEKDLKEIRENAENAFKIYNNNFSESAYEKKMDDVLKKLGDI